MLYRVLSVKSTLPSPLRCLHVCMKTISHCPSDVNHNSVLSRRNQQSEINNPESSLARRSLGYLCAAIKRQRHDKARADAHNAFGLDGSMMRFDDLLHNGEAQS